MSRIDDGGRLGAPAPRRIVVFRALQLGDMLCAVPALRALRAAYPGAEMVLVGLPWAAAFVDRYRPYLDGFREFPGDPALPERVPELARIPPFYEEMRRERFDLALQMHGSGRVTNRLVARLGAKAIAGFYEPGAFRPDGGRFLAYPSRGTEVRRLLGLVGSLGAPAQDDRLEFPIWPGDRRALREITKTHDLRPRRYACIHPGASVPERRWGPERFARVADALAGRGLRIVLTGTAGEAGLTRAVARLMRSPSIDLAGKTDLGTVAALIDGARLLICNDTGVSHLAAALRVPSVVISTGTNPERWAPADRQRHRVLCRDAGVTPGEVLIQARKLLREFAGHPDRSAVLEKCFKK
jgi:ADP-heptose:LPS heptosyltransferase